MKNGTTAMRLLCLVLSMLMLFSLAACGEGTEKRESNGHEQSKAPEIIKDNITYKGVSFYFPHAEMLYNNDNVYDKGYFCLATYFKNGDGEYKKSRWRDVVKVVVIDVGEEVTPEYVERRVSGYAGNEYKFYDETDKAIIYEQASIMGTSARSVQVFFKGTTKACEVRLYQNAFDPIYFDDDLVIVPGYKMLGEYSAYFDEKDVLDDYGEIAAGGYFLNEALYKKLVSSISYVGEQTNKGAN